MHTLLPYDDFKLSALALTDQLLKQQVVDCITILETLHETGQGDGDFDHPTVQAWRGCELQLCEFGLNCAEQYLKRHIGEKWVESNVERLEFHLDLAEGGDMEKPSWFGEDWVHLEYKGLLLFLDPDHYETIWPNVAPLQGLDRFRYPTAA